MFRILATSIVATTLIGCGAAGGFGSATLTGCADGEQRRGGGEVDGGEPRASVDDDVIVVEAPIAHACCLTGTTSIARTADGIQVSVTMSGEPCRCMCGSALVARSEPLPAGSHRVVLVVDSETRLDTRVELSGS